MVALNEKQEDKTTAGHETYSAAGRTALAREAGRTNANHHRSEAAGKEHDGARRSTPISAVRFPRSTGLLAMDMMTRTKTKRRHYDGRDQPRHARKVGSSSRNRKHDYSAVARRSILI